MGTLESLLTVKWVSNKRVKGIPFVFSYHPLLKQLTGIIQKHLYLLHINVNVKKIITTVPVVSFRSSRKISSCLVRAKLYPQEL